MRVLYDLIHEKAKATFREPVTKDSFERWRQHWIATARVIQIMMSDEGLTETAKAIDEIAKFEEKTL